MIYNLYSVRDDAQNSFAAPFMDVSDTSAMRGFRFAFDSSPNLIKFCPEDFRLFRIGQFDSDSGVIFPLVTPVSICSASSFRKVGVDNETSSL